MSYPIVQQANSWFGIAICYIAIMGIYYSNVWNVRDNSHIASCYR